MSTPGNDGSRMVAALESAFADIAARHVELPRCVVLIGDGDKGNQRIAGHFAATRWTHEDGQVHELVVTAQRLQDGPEMVLETLLHEAAHALCAARGVKDTSRQGRYHNTAYRDAAVELGLTVDSGPNGWNITDLAEGTAKTYKRTLVRLAEALKAHVAWGERNRPKARQSQIPGYCACGRIIRASASCWEEAAITCSECGEDFAPDADKMIEARIARGTAVVIDPATGQPATTVTDWLRDLGNRGLHLEPDPD